MVKLPSIPSVSSRVPVEISALLRPMREILTAFTAGNGVAMKSDLAGVKIPDPSGWIAAGTDPSTPPAPTGLTIDGALVNIILSWDATTYANLSHTEIWRAQTNDFSLAQLVGRGDGRVYVDSVGGAAVRFYWIRYISRSNKPGPFNAQGGTRGETSQDPRYLLELLKGELDQSQLNTELGAKIDLIGTNAAAIGAHAQSITQLQAVVSDPATGLVTKYAAVKTTADATVTALGKVQAKYTVNVEVDGVAGGFGIIGTGDGLTNKIDFGVRASTFFIAAPNGAGISAVIPFIVRTTATIINGVNVPIGVYIADAMISNGTITNAKIGDAAIDNAKIASLDAGKINTGYLDANRIQVGTLDAKIANLDAAVIGTGFINAARINSASIANATIGAAQISSGIIDSARINTASIANATISLAQIDRATVSSLAALSGTIGLLKSSNALQHTELDNNGIRVYDALGTLRVRLGVW